ncbi:hypothetical protein SAMN06272771_3370 [Streptomyces sp. Ag82_O1-12]|uniref:hypothetical protein n=1 Tax=Streptomyces sp. Ag82_O1-12 TaxID=1938854 RepID=UPI000BC600A3|nr:MULTISPECIES: hypothetical protein [unclassified Streptomyces]SMQ16988.1 hypothetical protein SAMN06272771_3370 [Streptomyces sp. Ag82_O1-12]SOD46017.1 hypothetical protein SAMN06272727_3367 [Streptomyces sp. Ag82_G6-1]
MTVTDVERSAVESPPTAAPLRARPGLHYAPVPGGVYFSGTRGQFVLRGSELLYAVADGCVPLLRAGTTEDALVAEFGTERARPAVRHLLGKLRENGLLLDPATLTEPEPPAELAARHADTLARLTARLDDPYAAFARLRRARVRLHGPTTATAPALRGLRRAGVADVTATAVPVTPPTPLVPVCDPAMYADPALLSGRSGSAGGSRALIPAGAPAVRPVPTPAGDPAVQHPLTPVGDPAVQHPLTPAGDPAVDAGTRTPVGDPAVTEPGTRTPVGDPAVTEPGTRTPVGGPAVNGHGATTPVGGPAVTASVTAEGVPRVVVEFLDGDRTWIEEDGTLHVPVLLGPGPVLVGPVGVAPGVWQVFRDRARAWADAEGVEPATGPIAHSLAGALAAQLLTDTLTSVAEPGEAHVVHGHDLTADRVTVTGAPVSEAVAVRLADAPAEPLPAPEDALDAAGVLTARWTGLFASAQGEDLPQMPVALRAAEHRADRTGTVTAWAAHQETATIAAALAALRDRATDATGTPAAGLTREHWLLDGALRRLARTDGDVLDTDAPLHAEGHRIAAELRALLGEAEPVLAVSRYAGVGWPLAEVTVDGRPLGAGWGPTAAEATYAALCTALAVAQTGGTAGRLSTDALLTADGTTRAALREQLTARAVHEGQPRRTDPVLGELPFWHGPVTAHAVPTTAEEATDAGH